MVKKENLYKIVIGILKINYEDIESDIDVLIHS